jgi:succinate dehydrogenase / fumarate reductase flavoprotein subunit
MARNAEGLNQAIVEIAALRERRRARDKGFNQELEKARVADFLNWESYLLRCIAS